MIYTIFTKKKKIEKLVRGKEKLGTEVSLTFIF
jgi:hypothetical protein